MNQTNKVNKDIPLSLSLISWNIYGGLPWGFTLNNHKKRVDKIVKSLKESKSDIICLQEVQDFGLISYLKKSLGEEYEFYYKERTIILPYIILFTILFLLYYSIHDICYVILLFVFTNFILKNLNAYNYIFGEVNGCLLTLVSKATISSENIDFELCNFKEQDGDILNLLSKRAYHKLIIKKDKLDRDPLLLINSHTNFLSKGQIDLQNRLNKCMYREKQIRELEEETRAYKYAIIAADLNSLAEFKEIHFEEYQLVDCFLSNDKDKDENNTWDINNPLVRKNDGDESMRIDYTLGKNLHINNALVVFKEDAASDHYGLRCEFKLEEEKRVEEEEEKEIKKNKKEKKKEKEKKKNIKFIFKRYIN